jgi:GNAT superfamily N-acetyltransferase
MAIALATDLQITDKTLRDLSDEEYRALLNLNMGPKGSMRSRMRYLRHARDARAIYATNDKGIIVSWVLLFSYYTPGKTAFFYTRARYRRKGYGTYLAAYVRRHYRKIEVCPWDDASRAFFRQQRFRVQSGYKID